MKLKALTLIAALACGTVYAQTVEVTHAWARATVKGQMATGAFMKITARDGATLIGVSSPAAGVAGIHEMKMEGDIMKMRAVQGGLDLPAGKAVELKPGGDYHLMLMDLKAPLAKGSTLPLTLVFSDGKGVESKVELKVPVTLVAPDAKAAGKPAMNHDMHKH
jgi:copper(I)-binding protein